MTSHSAKTIFRIVTAAGGLGAAMLFGPANAFAQVGPDPIHANHVMDPAGVSASTASSYIQSAAADARKVNTEFGLPASVTVAQSALESGYGGSSLSTDERNYFGIKCSSTGFHGSIASGCKSEPTQECDSSGCHSTTASFRVYPSRYESFRDYGSLISTLSRYGPAMAKAGTPDEFIREVARDGWATDPDYADKVLSIMSRYNTYQFDAPSAPAPVPAADRPGVSVSADGTVLTYARKGDHEIMVKTLTNGTWSAPVDALGITPGQPRISGDGGSIFFRVGDGRVARTYRSSDGRWHPATIGGAARGNISPNRNGTIAYYSDQGNGRVARAVYNSATGKFSVANFGTQNARGDLTTNATGTSVFYVTPAGRPYQTYDSPSGVHEVALPNTTNVNTVAINADANQTYYPTPDGTVTINSYNGSKWVTTPTGGTSAQSLAVTADGGAVYFPTPSTKFPTNDWHTTGNWNGPAALLTSTTTNRALTTAATAGTGVFEVDTNGNLVDISIKNGTWNGQIIERNATDA